MLQIDGSYGEGGGQILRSSLTLSILTERPFRMYNLRVKRKKPGLMPQHLSCVKACQVITKAHTEGAHLGSTELVFIPKSPPKGGSFYFDIGTAGATALLFQTIFMPLALTQGGELTLKGGTHIPHSPTFHYLKYVYLPFLAPFGFSAELSLEKAGFYPQGGGLIKAYIFPTKILKIPTLPERFELKEITIFSLITQNLPDHILERQAKAAQQALVEKGYQSSALNFERVESLSPGTMVFILLKALNLRTGFSSIGAKGLPAEEVGKSCARLALEFLNHGAQADPHLADQVLLPMAYLVWLNKTKTITYTTSQISLHLLTQGWLIPQFLDTIEIKVEKNSAGLGVVRIERG